MPRPAPSRDGRGGRTPRRLAGGVREEAGPPEAAELSADFEAARQPGRFKRDIEEEDE